MASPTANTAALDQSSHVHGDRKQSSSSHDSSKTSAPNLAETQSSASSSSDARVNSSALQTAASPPDHNTNTNVLETTASPPSSSPNMTLTALEPTVLETTFLETTVLEDSPYEPDAREADLYYSSLPSRPRLVARSSGVRWRITHPTFVSGEDKAIRNVGRHPIVDCWNAQLQRQIVEALGSTRWTSIDVVRIGMEENAKSNQALPVVLWIGVPNGSLTWREGMDIVNACIAILRTHGLSDVQCEIRESEFKLLGSTPQSVSYLSPLPPTHTSADLQLRLTASPGQSVSSMKSDAEGTLGLYLKTGGSNPHSESLWGLTCRHVLHPYEDTETAYRSKPHTDQPITSILSPGNSDLEKIRDTAEREAKTFSNHVARLGRGIKSYPEKAQELKEAREKYAIQLKDAQEFAESKLPKWKSQASRVLGYLRYAPAIEVADPVEALDIAGPRRDWALIEVNKEKFSKPVTNTVDIVCGALLPNQIFKQAEEYRGVGLREDWHSDLTGKVDLRQTVPMKELRNPSMFDRHGEPCLLVGKRGTASGMTWGRMNEVKSIVWENNMQSMEWCVLPGFHNGSCVAFSEPGDSGSCVFDINGRVVGIIVGGVGNGTLPNRIALDVTYVTPMEWLQQDMKKHGYSVEIA